jgi:AraC family transcriptional regulator, transcriptional activator FtrA
MPSRRPLVVVLATQSFSPFELAAACELFGLDRRDLTPRWYRFAIVGPRATTWHGRVRLSGFEPTALAKKADTLVVPGYAGLEAPPQKWMVDALQTVARRGGRVVSFCSGAFALAHAGLLRSATTHWMHVERFRQCFPHVTVDASPLWVQQGNIWTAAGTASCIDLGLALIAEDYGQRIANQVARRMVAAPTRSGGQAQFIERPLPVASDGLEPAREYVRAHLGSAHSVASMARLVGMSPRSFARHFVSSVGTTPHAWLLEQRIAQARLLLEERNLSVDEIAQAVGLSSPTLRSRFRLAVGMPPTSYRHAFGASMAATRARDSSGSKANPR